MNHHDRLLFGSLAKDKSTSKKKLKMQHAHEAYFQLIRSFSFSFLVQWFAESAVAVRMKQIQRQSFDSNAKETTVVSVRSDLYQNSA